ncbi:MAG: permease-like cell division protein FtsX [Pseudomonadota bacterium]|nr:permease-like cell division protein FtsX [Pseudomonadota bacterium]
MAKPEVGRAGASSNAVTWRNRLDAWLQQHQLVAIETLLRLLAKPIGSMMTWLVIAISLTLPGTLWMALDNMTQLSDRFQASGSMSVYLQPGLAENDALTLQRSVGGQAGVASVVYISASQALDEFRTSSGLGDALDLLPDNPLPGVLIVEPELSLAKEAVLAMAQTLESDSRVDAVELDTAWLERLYALLALGERVVWVMAALLALGIVLVVGNTIRLSIANRVDEIRVTKLVGATNAWVRRPFLYTGLWYGMVGGLMSWILLVVGWLLVRGPVAELAALYGSDYTLQPLSAGAALLLLLGAMLLGWVGAWWSVFRHLHHIEP